MLVFPKILRTYLMNDHIPNFLKNHVNSLQLLIFGKLLKWRSQ